MSDSESDVDNGSLSSSPISRSPFDEASGRPKSSDSSWLPSDDPDFNSSSWLLGFLSSMLSID